MNINSNKRGQVTVFIIIAIVIVIIGVLIFLLWPRIFSTSSFDVKNPERFLQQCVEKDLKNSIKLISSQGGEFNPTNYYLYKGDKLNYLCYINEYYKLCRVQEPFLQNSMEGKITDDISPKVDDCWASLIESYEKKSYIVSDKKGTLKTEILPEEVILSFIDYELSVTKDDVEIHKSFNIILNNNIYELLEFASNIVEWEATIGEADMWSYMIFFKHLKAEKIKQTDDTKVYILTNKNTGEKFQFASRSLAFPPGIF